MGGVLGLFCVVVAATGDWLVVFVYGIDYAGTALALLLLSATLLMTGLGSVVGNGLWAINRPSLNFAADVGTIVVSVGFGVALIPSLSITGAAAASLLGATVGAAIRTATLVGSLGGMSHALPFAAERLTREPNTGWSDTAEPSTDESTIQQDESSIRRGTAYRTIIDGGDR